MSTRCGLEPRALVASYLRYRPRRRPHCPLLIGWTVPSLVVTIAHCYSVPSYIVRHAQPRYPRTRTPALDLLLAIRRCERAGSGYSRSDMGYVLVSSVIELRRLMPGVLDLVSIPGSCIYVQLSDSAPTKYSCICVVWWRLRARAGMCTGFSSQTCRTFIVTTSAHEVTVRVRYLYLTRHHGYRCTRSIAMETRETGVSTRRAPPPTRTLTYAGGIDRCHRLRNKRR